MSRTGCDTFNGPSLSPVDSPDGRDATGDPHADYAAKRSQMKI